MCYNTRKYDCVFYVRSAPACVFVRYGRGSECKNSFKSDYRHYTFFLSLSLSLSLSLFLLLLPLCELLCVVQWVLIVYRQIIWHLYVLHCIRCMYWMYVDVHRVYSGVYLHRFFYTYFFRLYVWRLFAYTQAHVYRWSSHTFVISSLFIIQERKSTEQTFGIGIFRCRHIYPNDTYTPFGVEYRLQHALVKIFNRIFKSNILYFSTLVRCLPCYKWMQ